MRVSKEEILYNTTGLIICVLSPTHFFLTTSLTTEPIVVGMRVRAAAGRGAGDARTVFVVVQPLLVYER